MKIKLLLTFFIVTAVNCKVLSQNCAVSDKKDPFTNDHIIETDDIKVYGSAILETRQWGFYLSFKKKGADFLLCANDKQYQSNGTTKFDRVILKLSDNSLIDLTNLTTEGDYSQGADWRYQKSYSKVTKDDLNKLATLKITNIRFVSGSENFDAEVSNGKANKIAKLVSCILSYQ